MLNDHMHELEKSPHGVTHLLTHPPMSKDDKWLIEHANKVALEHNERILPMRALEVLPTFHADYHKFLFAGGNCIEDLKPLKYGKTKDGKKTVTLELPSWWK
jgi:hypothetical protein